VFYDRLQEVLVESGFDGFVEGLCKSYYAPGRYFRMHLVGYFEGTDSERGGRVALHRQPVAQGPPAPEAEEGGAGSFLAVEDPRPVAIGGS
jgi:hypothetical protein